MENKLRVSIETSVGYQTFLIHNVKSLLNKIKHDPYISSKYKKMKEPTFKQWVLSNKITKKQFEKLQKLNNELISKSL